jgi:hypothetical protein
MMGDFVGRLDSGKDSSKKHTDRRITSADEDQSPKSCTE